MRRRKYKPKRVDMRALEKALADAENFIASGNPEAVKLGELMKGILQKRIEEARAQLAEPKKVRGPYTFAEATAEKDD